jgi:transmembrane sensor
MKKRNNKNPVKGNITPGQQDLIRQYFEGEAERDIPEEADLSFNSDELYSRIQQTINKDEQRPNMRNVWKYAASVAVFAGIILAAGYRYMQNTSAPDHITLNQQKAARGHISKMELPDGTVVWLNAGSKLYFPQAFAKNKREVTLEGEAYFDVKHENERPFLVHTQNVVTQVLGTSFNISSYAESGRIKVTVLSGKVAVYETAKNGGKQPLMVTASQEVIYSKVKQELAYNLKPLPPADAAAWKQGNLIFKNTELSEVIQALERRYDIKIQLDSTMQHCPITVNFNNQAVEQVMRILPRLVEGELSINKGTYRLSGAGCH